jgi:hypothetical protein
MDKNNLEKKKVPVDYANAKAWKQRLSATAKAEEIARRAMNVSRRAMRASGIECRILTEKARKLTEESVIASREAEQVWEETSEIINYAENPPSSEAD